MSEVQSRAMVPAKDILARIEPFLDELSKYRDELDGAREYLYTPGTPVIIGSTAFRLQTKNLLPANPARLYQLRDLCALAGDGAVAVSAEDASGIANLDPSNVKKAVDLLRPEIEAYRARMAAPKPDFISVSQPEPVITPNIFRRLWEHEVWEPLLPVIGLASAAMAAGWLVVSFVVWMGW